MQVAIYEFAAIMSGVSQLKAVRNSSLMGSQLNHFQVKIYTECIINKRRDAKKPCLCVMPRDAGRLGLACGAGSSLLALPPVPPRVVFAHSLARWQLRVSNALSAGWVPKCVWESRAWERSCFTRIWFDFLSAAALGGLLRWAFSVHCWKTTICTYIPKTFWPGGLRGLPGRTKCFLLYQTVF